MYAISRCNVLLFTWLFMFIYMNNDVDGVYTNQLPSDAQLHTKKVLTVILMG